MTDNGMTTDQIRMLISRLTVPGATHSKIDALCHLIVWLSKCELERLADAEVARQERMEANETSPPLPHVPQALPTVAEILLPRLRLESQ
jgi:hypothetical protein